MTIHPPSNPPSRPFSRVWAGGRRTALARPCSIRKDRRRGKKAALVIDRKRNWMDGGMETAGGGAAIYIAEVATPHGRRSWTGRHDSGLPALASHAAAPFPTGIAWGRSTLGRIAARRGSRHGANRPGRSHDVPGLRPRTFVELHLVSAHLVADRRRARLSHCGRRRARSSRYLPPPPQYFYVDLVVARCGCAGRALPWPPSHSCACHRNETK
jgi:hypothetical protein